MIRRGFLGLLGALGMTIPGLGGQTPPRPDQQYAGQAGVPIGPGSTNVVRANKVIVFGAGEGVFVYNGTPAAGNLIASVTSMNGTDQFGNNYVGGVTSYLGGDATSMEGGQLVFLTGTLAGGWTEAGALSADVSGDLLSSFPGSLFLSGGLQVAGTLTVGGSGSTGAGDNGGVTSGPSGTVNAFPAAGPNHTHAEFHHHPF